MLPKALEIHLRSCRPGRIIGEKLKSHSGKAGGNLGASSNPHEIARRPGSAPRSAGAARRRATPGSRERRVPIRERIAQHARLGSESEARGRGGGGGGGFDFGDVVVAEPGGRSDRRSSNSAPGSDQLLERNGSSSRLASSAAKHLGVESRRSASSVFASGESSPSAMSGGEWHEAFDPKSGRNFYYNANGETRWTLPRAGPKDSDSRPSPDALSHDVTRGSASGSMSERNTAREDRGTPKTRGSRDSDGGRAGGGLASDSSRISKLESKVATLENQLANAMAEIARLTKVMGKFQAVFAGGSD